MPFTKLRPAGVIALAVCACISVASPAGAAADATSVYPPDPEAREFGAGPGGWSSSESFASCDPGLTCPTAESSFQPSGGSGGEGHLRSSFSGALGVVGTATAVWSSPAFAYTGAGGSAPTSLSLTLQRRSDVGELLGAAGSTATYTVELVDLTAGASVPAIGSAPLAGADEWTQAPAALLDPSSLTLGHSYAIRIASSYAPAPLAVLVEGSADYDDVALVATRASSTVPVPAPPTASPAARVVRRSSSTRLRALVRRRSPATARLRGRWVFVRVACPRRARGACRIALHGRIKKRVRVTRRRSVRVGRGKVRVVGLKVRKRFRAKVRRRKRLLIVQRVRVRRAVITFSRSRALIRRRR